MNAILEWLLGLDTGELAGTDWDFGFLAEYDQYVTLLMVVVFAAMVYLVVRSYRREGDAPARAKGIMTGLRIFVIFLVFLVLFQPAIVLHISNTVYRSVVVLLDDSLSMSHADRYTDKDVSDAKGQTVEFLQIKPELLQKLKRVDLVRMALDRSNGVLDRLRANHRLLLYRFPSSDSGQDKYVELLGRFEPENGDAQGDQATSKPARPASVLDGLTSAGTQTNIPRALREVVRSLQGRQVAGVVIISDGRVTRQGAGDGISGARDYARKSGMPVYTVLVGDWTQPKNLTITALGAPREVRRSMDVEFTVALTHRKLDGENVIVVLERRKADDREWTEVASSDPVSLARHSNDSDKGSTAPQVVTIRHRPDELGEFVYRARVKPIGGEQNEADNVAEAVVKVSDEKIRILLISGDAGKEFQFLRDFLFRQKDLYRLSVWQQDADVEVNQLASTGMKLTQLPQTLSELIGVPGDKKKPGYDVVILYDPQPTDKGFDDNFARLISQFVRKHRGGLCFIASNKYTEQVLGRDPLFKPLSELIPVSVGSTAGDVVRRIYERETEPWQVRLTPYGVDHPIMRLDGSTSESRERWSELAGIYWSHPVHKVKPAARVLAESSNPMRRTSKKKPEPLVAVQAVGTGRVVYVGTDETWRWRLLPELHRRFWSNVVRYLASLKARQIIITAGGDRFEVGGKITVEAEAYDENFNPRKDETLDIEMTDVKTGKSETLRLEKVAGRDGRYRITIPALHTGTYELTALKGDPQAREKVAVKRITIELSQEEMRRLDADVETMKGLATRDRNFLNLWEIDRLAELMPSKPLPIIRDERMEIWDSNLTLLLIVILLGIEWLLRKKYNMA